jgi:hypothetical protein
MSFEEGMWMVLNLKPLRRLALGKGAEGEALEICQMRDIGSLKAMGGHGEYCEAMHSMQKHDKTYQHTMHTLTGK